MNRRRNHWIVVPLTALTVHTAFILVQDLDRTYGLGFVQYALFVIDPVLVLIAARRDMGGNEATKFFYLWGGIQWLIISLGICTTIEIRRLFRRPLDRLKKGLCPACAYPIGTSEVCTECGYAFKHHEEFKA